jgi:dimeric dUTPase (all-alpha-NTP-PPase superfamily)
MNYLEDIYNRQKKLNESIDPDWIEKGSERQVLAIIEECGELINHLGYKWWKKTEVNEKQAALEVVDILHFLVSYMIIQDDDYDYFNKLFNKHYIEHQLNCTIETVPDFLHHLLCDDIEEIICCFALICSRFNLDLPTLHSLYIGKNVLNKFRQDNGYKGGTYLDNEVLYDICSDVELRGNIDEKQLYDYLNNIYMHIA